MALATVDADGVHLGEDDGAVAAARALVGPERIIGVSCYNRFELAEGAKATLTPLMQAVEAAHPSVRVFSLPSVDHPVYGRHIELGVKGAPPAVPDAYRMLRSGLAQLGIATGPELVR